MDISQTGLNLIESFEGCKLSVYPDQRNIPTIGIGHTGSDVYFGMPDISQEQAYQFLTQDCQTASNCINDNVTVDLTQNMFDALCSFVYNVGSGNFESSTLLKELNNGNYTDIPTQMLRWDKVDGAVSDGLLRRRTAEGQLFNS